MDERTRGTSATRLNPLMMKRCAATFDGKRCGQPAGGHGDAHTAHIPFYAPWFEEADRAGDVLKIASEATEDECNQLRTVIANERAIIDDFTRQVQRLIDAMRINLDDDALVVLGNKIAEIRRACWLEK